MIMNPTRIWKHISDHGARYEFAIETARGLFAGVIPMQRVHRLPSRFLGPDQVDIWHLVPRWMSPVEVLQTIEP